MKTNSNMFMLRKLFSHKKLAISTILVLLLSPTYLHADRIIVVGDSWADPMVVPLQEILAENGHKNIIVHKAKNWYRSSLLAHTTGLDWISSQLEQYPDTTIIHLSIGGNDWLYEGAPDWTVRDYNSYFGAVINNVEIIADHILSIQPSMKILWSSYDYLRPTKAGSPAKMNAAQDAINELAAQLALNKPGLSFVNLNGTLQAAYGFDGIQHTQFDPPFPIPPGDPSLPDPTLPSPSVAFKLNDTGHLTEDGYKVIVQRQYDLFYAAALAEQTFQINPGLNDAWYNPATNGQGFLITVFPNRKEVFLAWFTFDTERPPEDVTAILGEPGHRWLTAQGPYDGDAANLTIYVTKGGVFDSAEPAASADLDGDGTMTLEFADCENGLVTYEITSLGISGEIPIQRIAMGNVPLCESL